MNIIPFDGAKGLPAYLKKVDVSALNADLTSHAGSGFPVISIKGKVFAVVRDGEREVLRNPKDPESAATSLNVVLLKANKGTSKVFYIKGYDPKESENQKPDCYSQDGVAPAADDEATLDHGCGPSPKKKRGSRITEKGASKGKACSDTVRMAVAPAGQLNDPMLLRVPPASIKGLGEYGQMLAKRGVGYNMVVTKVAFDMDAESPKLTFTPVGLLDDDGFNEVQEALNSDIVNNILGASLATVAAAVEAAPAAEAEEAEAPAPKAKPAVSKAKTVTDDEVETAVAAAEKPAEKPKAKPVAKPVATVDEDMDLDLDGISFDD